VELRQSLLNLPVLQQGCELVHEFQRMMQKRDMNKFADWLQAGENSKIPEFVNLAAGMKKDNDAIKAAFSSQWSNGQTEGQVNRLKLLKRLMYG
jgi:transposase